MFYQFWKDVTAVSTRRLLQQLTEVLKQKKVLIFDCPENLLKRIAQLPILLSYNT